MSEISRSTNKWDYEILIRKRGESEYASYCPQLNYMLMGTEHAEVEMKMEEYIHTHIKEIQNNENS